MTNEEAVKIIKAYKDRLASSCSNQLDNDIEAFTLAIKALETGEVYMTGEDYNLYMEGYKAGKKDFEPKQGKWIKVTKAGTVPVEYICSLCRRKIYDNYELTTPIDEFYPFCHCGADMRKGGAE